MKAFLSAVISNLVGLSRKLDKISLLANQSWVNIDIDGSKNIFFFQNPDRLIISKNGTATFGRWEFLPGDRLLLSIQEEHFITKQGFFDENVLALKIENTIDEKYILFVNEGKYDAGEIRTPWDVDNFLYNHYVKKEEKKLQDNQKNILKKQIMSYSITKILSGIHFSIAASFFVICIISCLVSLIVIFHSIFQSSKNAFNLGNIYVPLIQLMFCFLSYKWSSFARNSYNKDKNKLNELENLLHSINN